MPPPHPNAINFLTGESVPIPNGWNTSQFGKFAARHANLLRQTDTTRQKSRSAAVTTQSTHERAQAFTYRLVGSRTLVFTLHGSVRSTSAFIRRNLKLNGRSKEIAEFGRSGSGRNAPSRRKKGGGKAGLQQKKRNGSGKRSRKRKRVDGGGSERDAEEMFFDDETGEPMKWEGVGEAIQKHRDNGRLSMAEESSAWLDEIVAAAHPAVSPWKCPLFACRARLNSSSTGKSFTIDVGIYLGRLIFYLIADAFIKRLLDPILTGGVTPTVIEKAAPVFTNSADHEKNAKQADPFSIGRILQRQESTGYRSAPHIEGLALKMKPYQSQSLQWMLDQEASPMGLNYNFWKAFSFADGEPFYYSSLLGELRLEEPPVVRGGLLTEEMGLGKTLECVALILATKQPIQQEKPRREVLTRLPLQPYVLVESPATLIIVPEPLVAQWESEVAKSLICRESLKVMTYLYASKKRTGEATDGVTSPVQISNIFRKISLGRSVVNEDTNVEKLISLAFEGSGFNLRSNLSVGDRQSCEKIREYLRKRCTFDRFVTAWHVLELAQADVVITTFTTVQQDGSRLQVLSKVGWERVMIDEMQFMRSPTTLLAKATRKLSAQFRWMISGTPLYSSINDLNGELQFLGVIPFCLEDHLDGFWGAKVKTPFENRDESALQLIAALLDKIMIRHSKGQRYTADNSRSILDLPSVEESVVAVKFQSPLEQACYEYLEVVTASLFEESEDRLTVASSVDILRLAATSLNMLNTNRQSRNSLLVKLNEIVRKTLRSERLAALIGETGRCLEMPANVLKMYFIKDRAMALTAGRGGGNSAQSSLGVHEQNLEEGKRKLEVCEKTMRLAKHTAAGGILPKLRWQWAVGCVRSGMYHLVLWICGKAVPKDCPLLASRMARLHCEYYRIVKLQPQQVLAGYNPDVDLESLCRLHNLPTKRINDEPVLSGDGSGRYALRVTLPGNASSQPSYIQVWSDDPRGRKVILRYIEQSSGHSRKALDRLCALSTMPKLTQLPSWFVAKCAGSSTRLIACRVFLGDSDQPDKLKLLTGDYFCSVVCYNHETNEAKVKFDDGSMQLVPLTALRFEPNAETESREDFQEAFDKCSVRYTRLTSRISTAPSLIDFVFVEEARSRVSQTMRSEHKLKQAEHLYKASTAAALRLFFNSIMNGNTLLRSVLPNGCRDKEELVQALAAACIEAIHQTGYWICPEQSKPSKDGMATALSTLFDDSLVVYYADACRKLGINLPLGGRWSTKVVQNSSGFSPILPEIACCTLANKAVPWSSFVAQKASKSSSIQRRGQRLAVLKRRLDDVRADVLSAEEMYQNVQPYVQLLQTVLDENPLAVGLTSLQGLQAVQRLVDGGKPRPQCAICLMEMKKPMCTQCIHLFCSTCLGKYAMAQGHGLATRSVPCPLCRRSVHLDQVIKVLPPDDGRPATSEHQTSKPNATREHPAFFPAPKTSNGALAKAWKALQEGRSVDEGRRLYSVSGSDSVAFSNPDSNSRRSSLDRWILREAEAIDHRFLRMLWHMTSSSSYYISSKLRKVTSDLKQVVQNDAQCVVFSQFRASIREVHYVLGCMNITSSCVIQGDDQESLKTALERFHRKEDSVLLLHSSTAAAGLTLTMASHVFLLEPFLNVNEEAQAVNRVHRIGQSATMVKVHRYYVVGSVEERIVAWRRQQEEAHKRGISSQEALSVLAGQERKSRLGLGLGLGFERDFLMFVAGVEEDKEEAD